MTRSISYAPLLRVTLHHGYYDDGLARGLSLTPTPATAALLASALCRIRVRPGLSEIWYGDQDGQAPARDLPARATFGFTLQSDDPNLLTVTQPDWQANARTDPVSGCLYLSNKGQVATAPLTVASSQAVLLPVQGRLMPVPADKTDLTLVRWIDDRVIWRGPEPGDPPGYIDLTGVPEDGRYLLKNASATLQDVYLTDRPATQFLGAVELAWTPDAFTTDLPRAVTLAFAARRGLWTYIISSLNPDRPMDQAQIIDAAGTALFGAPQPATLRGRKAWRFTSTSPLTLAGRYPPERRLSLKIPQFGMRIPAPISLPLPGPENAAPGTDSTLTFETYVTL